LSYFAGMAEADLTAWKRLLDTPEPPALGPTRRLGTLSEGALAEALSPLLVGGKITGGRAELIRALLLLWHDHLDASHNISQGIENADGSFIHAIMHRREPDAGNSKYWWRRVGNHPAFPEIARRVEELLRLRGAGDLTKHLLHDGEWNVEAFVDACDAAMNLPDDAVPVKVLREIQRMETEVLLEHLLRGGK